MSRPSDASDLARISRRRRPSSRRRDRRELTARSVLGAYLAGIAALAGAAALSIPFGLLAYPLIGIALSRHVGRRVRWIKHLASIRNISDAKFGLILRWPVEMPILAIRLAAARHL